LNPYRYFGFNFRLVKKFILFGNNQIPILCAVDGTDFGQSAEKAESLSPRNVARLKTITRMVFFIGQLVICTAVGIGCFYIFSNRIHFLNVYLPPTHHYMVPVFTTVLGAYLTSGLFFSVYAVAIDTILIRCKFCVSFDLVG
jgi:choline transporter-like protein 2/4/5